MRCLPAAMVKPWVALGPGRKAERSTPLANCMGTLACGAVAEECRRERGGAALARIGGAEEGHVPATSCVSGGSSSR